MRHRYRETPVKRFQHQRLTPIFGATLRTLYQMNSKKKLASAMTIGLFLVILALAACTVAPVSPESSPDPASSANSGGEQPSTAEADAAAGSPLGPDPFAYCASVGTIDTPEGDVGGSSNPGVPEVVATGLQQASGATGDAPIAENSYWRCMDDKVYACFVGANLPCTSKAGTSTTPTDAMNEFCAAQPDAGAIPANVTGRETVYSWRCVDGQAEAGEQVFEVDAQGYLADFWYEIDPAATSSD